MAAPSPWDQAAWPWFPVARRRSGDHRCPSSSPPAPVANPAADLTDPLPPARRWPVLATGSSGTFCLSASSPPARAATSPRHQPPAAHPAGARRLSSASPMCSMAAGGSVRRHASVNPGAPGVRIQPSSGALIQRPPCGGAELRQPLSVAAGFRHPSSPSGATQAPHPAPSPATIATWWATVPTIRCRQRSASTQHSRPRLPAPIHSSLPSVSRIRAQGGEGSDARGRGRGRRSGRVPPSPSAGTSWTQSAARNAINIDDNGDAGHAEDDDTDNNDDESDDDTDNESSVRPSASSTADNVDFSGVGGSAAAAQAADPLQTGGGQPSAAGPGGSAAMGPGFSCFALLLDHPFSTFPKPLEWLQNQFSQSI
ncbi:hypothetical protein PVAP13_7NG357524 [Panicum virgatum]|uniref:Uncharacterized protein n=1 Tax=Panicum virgatum TaxID=38727 RepID=A0A8T0PY18_PANVG|nr:hypothetical protein PVAP13_7NG357524 [Panicum virgatum]